MSFEPSKVEEFKTIFNNSKNKIAGFEGCNGVKLMQDFNAENVFYTYSSWDGEEFLNNYRHSELFEGVWKATKALFNDKPMAFSLKDTE